MKYFLPRRVYSSMLDTGIDHGYANIHAIDAEQSSRRYMLQFNNDVQVQQVPSSMIKHINWLAGGSGTDRKPLEFTNMYGIYTAASDFTKIDRKIDVDFMLSIRFKNGVHLAVNSSFYTDKTPSAEPGYAVDPTKFSIIPYAFYTSISQQYPAKLKDPDGPSERVIVSHNFYVDEEDTPEHPNYHASTETTYTDTNGYDKKNRISTNAFDIESAFFYLFSSAVARFSLQYDPDDITPGREMTDRIRYLSEMLRNIGSKSALIAGEFIVIGERSRSIEQYINQICREAYLRAFPEEEKVDQPMFIYSIETNMEFDQVIP